MCKGRPIKAVINGTYQLTSMQTHLSHYIEEFVLCSSCRLPETQYEFESNTIFRMCATCGAKHPIDMNHKLARFITTTHKNVKKEARENKSEEEINVEAFGEESDKAECKIALSNVEEQGAEDLGLAHELEASTMTLDHK